MPENAEPPPGLSTKEARRLQKKYQEKKKRMASHWFAWLEFEKYLSADTMYSRTVYKMVARISQTIALAKNVDNQTIRWDEARDRVLTLDVLQGLEKTYEKSFRTLHHDIAAVASHAS
ncbi:MAG: hypothetical protein KGI79_03690, partial [Patescibacteria group bacterium]|nr:hypothetical protein [Patescibacteria group bacterium]